MPHISIISSSVRVGRKSHRVALYFRDYLRKDDLATSEIIDLNEYQFPIFEERLNYISSPTEKMLEFAERVKAASGIIVVTPEYNGGYPASLKNAIDIFSTEFHRKPVAIATVSDGMFGGSQVITSLQFTLWKLHALTVPWMFPVPLVDKMFDETGKILDEELEKRSTRFINELMWYVEAVERMNL